MPCANWPRKRPQEKSYHERSEQGFARVPQGAADVTLVNSFRREKYRVLSLSLAFGLALPLAASVLIPTVSALCPELESPGPVNTIDGDAAGNCFVTVPVVPAPAVREPGSSDFYPLDPGAEGNEYLMATRHNTDVLANGNYKKTGELRWWDCPGQITCKRGGNQLAFKSATDKTYGSAKPDGDNTKVCDTEPDCQQCVSFVQAVALSAVLSKYWERGEPAIAGALPSGTVVATFNAETIPKYGPPGTKKRDNGHVAVLLGYKFNDKGEVTGIVVADQNWQGGPVKRHAFDVKFQPLSKSDAANYYAVIAAQAEEAVERQTGITTTV